jgi:hypothetical protein
MGVKSGKRKHPRPSNPRSHRKPCERCGEPVSRPHKGH